MDKLIEEMFAETTIKNDGRRYYGREKWYRVLWNMLYQEQLCEGYDIHHKDFDELNDNLDNLQRLTRSEHTRLHNIGKTHSEFTKKRLSISKIGKNNPMFGKPVSEETRKKISIANTGKNNPFYGKHHTEETKQKLSLLKNGMHHSEEAKRKISLNHADVSGSNHSQAKAVKINGRVFLTGVEASQFLGVSRTTIWRRINNNMMGYSYYEEGK